MDRLTRISYNSAGWRRPTGEAAEQEQDGTYNNLHRFGHEDWLFRDEWEIDGWRYAFIQGVGKSREALLKLQRPFDVTLFTVEPDKRRRYVANIREAEALDDEQAEAALQVFRTEGWLRKMEEEIEAVGGNAAALGDARWAPHVLNVRFRLERVIFFPAGTYADEGDPVLRRHRYQLYNIAEASEPHNRIGRSGSNLPPNIADALRRAVDAVKVSPEHAKMQARLMRELVAENPDALVVRERNYIDVLVETPDSLHLYEIKSDLSPSTVLRLAIGQLLEYAFRLPNPHGKRVVLVAVGRAALSAQDHAFLDHLNRRHLVSLEYRVVTLQHH